MREDVKIVNVVEIVASQVRASTFTCPRAEHCQIILQILLFLGTTLCKRDNKYNQSARKIKS